MGRMEKPGHHVTRGARLADESLGLGTGAASPPGCPVSPPCSISFPCPQPEPWAKPRAEGRKAARVHLACWDHRGSLLLPGCLASSGQAWPLSLLAALELGVAGVAPGLQEGWSQSL